MSTSGTRHVVLFEQSRGVATLTLNRPEARNSLSIALLNALGDHLAATATDESCRVVVLTNAGGTFSAGADMKPASKAEALRWPLHSVLAAILDHPKPVVGRIAGHCLGGGVGLAAACDISVATEEATFGFTEVRVGVAPAIISVVCLPKMRAGDARELFLSGERVTAIRAAEVGLVNAVAPVAELDVRIDEVTGRLRRGGPCALAATKRVLRGHSHLAREEAFAEMASVSAALFASEEAREGFSAFRERRDPAWTEDR